MDMVSIFSNLIAIGTIIFGIIVFFMNFCIKILFYHINNLIFPKSHVAKVRIF